MKVQYPQGGEKQLIDAVISRQVAAGALPISTGAVVQNVGTAFAVYQAVQKNKPLFERVITVTGKSLSKPSNFLARIGTPMKQLIDACGGLPEDTGKIIGGGPMMGKALVNTDEPLIEESDYHQIFSAETRNQLKRYADLWSQIPGLAQICNAGTYTWIVILLLGYLIYRKRWKGILVLAAPALNVAICIASPVNGLLRYAFPLMACMPAVIFWGLAYAEKAIDEKRTDEK